MTTYGNDLVCFVKLLVFQLFTLDTRLRPLELLLINQPILWQM